MQLNPKRPPGRADRKALWYASEVRRLRAEGHTLESIRLALLDVGVSVSLSTVRREVARSPSKWELEHAHEEPLAPHDWQHGAAVLPATPTPPLPDASSGQADGSGKGESTLVRIETFDARRSVGLLSKIFGALRQLRRVGWFP